MHGVAQRRAIAGDSLIGTGGSAVDVRPMQVIAVGTVEMQRTLRRAVTPFAAVADVRSESVCVLDRSVS